MQLPRRNFLQSVLSIPFLNGWWRDAAASSPPNLPTLFPHPELIRYDAQCFTIRGRDTLIFGAEFHYTRCPRPLWRDRLAKLRGAGFNTLQTYAFWNYHEPVRSQADLAEFEDFLTLAQEMGFFVIARPGPYICAEWHRGGFPDWVAAMRFPLRTACRRSLETSRHWYALVLPVVRRHQITQGGPIILMQIENEYDSSGLDLPKSEKIAYIEALARMAWAAGIEVPLITCKSREARDNFLPVMARIMDTCNFYPRWKIVAEVVPQLARLRRQEPDCPLAITELQGGWFSQFGGRLSVNQSGIGPEQLDTLTKTVLEQGVVSCNYYMGAGGTNFAWAAKTMTTTYDYAAPLREPGGLWEKYYAVRGIGKFLEHFGPRLVRARAVVGGALSAPAGVSVTLRGFRRGGVLFVRNNANATRSWRAHFRLADDDGWTRMPKDGALELGPREMKMLPIEVPLAGAWLRYTTAEVCSHGRLRQGYFLALYDVPGRRNEIAFASARPLRVEGDTLSQAWDGRSKTLRLNVRFTPKPQLLRVGERLTLALLPRDLALRSWEMKISANNGSHDFLIPIFSAMSRPLAGDGDAHGVWCELEYEPGDHEATLLMPHKPARCRVNGRPSDIAYDSRLRSATLRLQTPELPVQTVRPRMQGLYIDHFRPGSLGWEITAPRPLEDFGPDPYGYVKYFRRFVWRGEAVLRLESYTDDGKKVFLNGQYIAEASVGDRNLKLNLARYARPGINTLQIAYEAFGALNGKPAMGELKGIRSVRVGRGDMHDVALERWQIERFPAIVPGKNLIMDYPFTAWTTARKAKLTGAQVNSQAITPAFTWLHATFQMPALAAGWSVPWQLAFAAERDALLFLNRWFLGRYVTQGPQNDFYVPDTFLNPSGAENHLHICLAYTDHPGLRRMILIPYAGYSVHRTRIEIDF